MSTLQRHKSYRKISSGKATAVLLVAAFLAIVITVAIGNACDVAQERQEQEVSYDNMILKAGRRNNVDPDLIRAVIWRESNFDRNKKGSHGEIGLMQIMPNKAAADWAKAKNGGKQLNPAQLSDPEQNIEIGSWYLGRALEYWRKKGYKEYKALALCEYNAGRTRAQAWKPEDLNGSVVNRIEFKSTKEYVGDILRKYEENLRKTKSGK